MFFAAAAAFATIVGGGVPLLHRRLSERHLTLLVAFSGGVLLSTGLNHMIAESFAETGRWAMLGVSMGFVILYGYEKISMVHACREKRIRSADQLRSYYPSRMGRGYRSHGIS